MQGRHMSSAVCLVCNSCSCKRCKPLQTTVHQPHSPKASIGSNLPHCSRCSVKQQPMYHVRSRQVQQVQQQRLAARGLRSCCKA